MKLIFLLWMFSCFSSLRVPSGTEQRRQWHPTPVLLPGKSHGRRSLVGCSPRGRWESDTTEQLHFHFPLSCVGEGNGNPLQWSCLENPRDGGAWWAAVYGVAQSRIQLKRLSSSSRKSLRRWQLNIALRFMQRATEISAIWSLSMWPVGTAYTKTPNWDVLGMLTIRQGNQCGKKDW